MARRRLKRFVERTQAIWKLVSRLRAAGRRAYEIRRRRRSRAVKASAAAPRPLRLRLRRYGFVAADRGGHIPCAVVTPPGVPSLYSRFARSRLPWHDFSQNTGELIDRSKASPAPRANSRCCFMKKTRSFC